jgi:hypothetical protein
LPQQAGDSLSGLVTTGEVTVKGQTYSYIVRHLPPSSFPELPDRVADALTQRGCLIPQTYEAHHPENVVRGSFERAGSSDWAVLCTTNGTVSLLIFFDGNPQPFALNSALETRRLQVHDSTGVLGFNWGIDAADPQAIHDKQIGMSPKPARLDHDALADSVLDRKTIYHYMAKGNWSLLDMPD